MNLFKSYTFVIGLSAMAWPLRVVGGGPSTYILQGRLQVFTRTDQAVSREFNYFFEVRAQETNWTISTHSPQTDNAIAAWTAAGIDNKVYALTCFSPMAIAQITRTSSKINSFVCIANASVRRGLQPCSPPSSRIPILWIGLASSPVLREGRQSLYPVWDEPSETLPELCPAEIHRQESEPFFPIEIRFPFPETTALPHPPAQFVYRVASWTNVAGMQFPAEFRSVRYNARNAGQMTEYVGLVTNVMTGEMPPLTPPEMPAQTMVTDYTSTTNRNFVRRYVSADGGYKAFDETNRVALSRIVPGAKIRPHAGDTRFVRFIICGVMAAFVFVPFVLLKSQKSNLNPPTV